MTPPVLTWHERQAKSAGSGAVQYVLTSFHFPAHCICSECRMLSASLGWQATQVCGPSYEVMLAWVLMPGVGDGPIDVGVGTIDVGVGGIIVAVGTIWVGVLVGNGVGVLVPTGFPAFAGDTMAAITIHKPRKTSRTGRDLRILNTLLQINA